MTRFALQMPIPIRRGFTLSYLRRVPELALLATRVTEAVARRYLQAERQKLRDAGLLKKGKPLPASYALSKKRLRTKQLFQRTIVKMFEEGAMALWDGPVYLCPGHVAREYKSIVEIEHVRIYRLRRQHNLQHDHQLHAFVQAR